jgi:hypothetical protein
VIIEFSEYADAHDHGACGAAEGRVEHCEVSVRAMGSLGGDTIAQCPDDMPYPSRLMPVGMRGAQCMWSSLTIRLRMRL